MSSTTPQQTQPVSSLSASVIARDLTAGLVVFLVALPLCLGIALASTGAPLFSGLLAGIVGGIIVGLLSGSQSSVSGPAAGLTAVVAAQIAGLGSFDAFLLAVFIAGILQVGLGIARAGSLAAFFPSSVIKGLLAAIGVILILKQIPHVLGHDTDPEGEMSFTQPDHENTFSEIWTVIAGDIHGGAVIVGLVSIAILVLWEKIPRLKKSVVPGPLIVVLAGVGVNMLLHRIGGHWIISGTHLVQIPMPESADGIMALLRPEAGLIRFPDFSQWTNPAIYTAAFTIAVVASLETLLNLQAVDKLDKRQRQSPPSRELLAQGVGNMACGLLGGLPVTSVIVRGSVNLNAGASTKLSAVFHGILLVVSVVLLPHWLNMIPLAALAAILLVTGFKLASPALFRQMLSEGRYQFLPFIVTLVSIVLTDLLVGILIGLCVSVLFILNSNLRRPIRRIVETHLGGDILHIELTNQVSFLNRASLMTVLSDAPAGSHVLIDASDTDYMDPDVRSLIREFQEKTGPARGVTVSLRGFREKHNLSDQILFADYSTRELQDKVTPQQVLKLLREGNRRFLTGNRLTRDFSRQVIGTAGGQNPLAVVLSCIDSRVPAELVFDLGIGDIFSVRVAGNVPGAMELGSIEYGVAVAGVRLVLVLGHTRCGAVTSSIRLLCSGQTAEEATGCTHLDHIMKELEPSLDKGQCRLLNSLNEEDADVLINEVARRNVQHTVDAIVERSATIRQAVEDGIVLVVGAMYDVTSGEIEFFVDKSAAESPSTSVPA
ncbi:MAG: SulP family inorganic anion transporter [Fuerstiella sp.]